MKKVLIILLVNNFFVNIINAQTSFNSYVFDIITREPIPFATVKNITKRIAFYANERGEINSEVNKGDTIIISCVGYEEKKMVVPARVDTFFLIPRQIVLKEVSVSNLALPEISIGLVNKKTGISSSSQVFVEFAIKISLPKGNDYYQLKKILLRAKKTTNDNDRIRLHVYKPDKSGFPGEEMLPKDILINDYDRKKGIIEIDISDLDLYIEDEIVFIGFEFIGKINKEFPKENGSTIYFTLLHPEPVSYSRTILDTEHKWHLMDAASPWAVPFKNRGLVPNLLASIVIQ
jgi:hypothetical protein